MRTNSSTCELEGLCSSDAECLSSLTIAAKTEGSATTFDSLSVTV